MAHYLRQTHALKLGAALIILISVVLVLALIPSAHAATPIYVRTDGNDTECDGTSDVAYPGGTGPLACAVQTIGKGLSLVDPSGTVNVAAGTYALASAVTVPAGVTLSGAGAGSTIVQVSGTGERILLTGSGATLQGFEIVKTDKTGVQNIIYIGASNVTVQNNLIHGQYVFGDPEVSRAMVMTGGLSGLLINNNTIHSLRQPAYVSGPTTGVVSNNTVYGTRGWVLEQGDLTFTNNQWGSGNTFDIAILGTVSPAYYTDIVAMSNANNGAVIEDQRVAPAVLSVVYVNASAAAGGNGGRIQPYQAIQQGIDRVVAGGLVKVYPGTYSETAAGRYLFNASGPYQFGLFVSQGKSGITLQGVDAAGQPITAYSNVLATVNTNATNSFGPSGVFIEGDNVTIAGIRVGINTSGQNKTIEVIGDNFTLQNCDIADVDGSVYLNDWRFDTGSNTSHVQSYTISGNRFQDGVSLDLASGAGYSGPVSGRQVNGNIFVLGAGDYWPSISFNGSGTGVPWFVHSVGGAVITGNQFSGGEQIIRARGAYDNSQFDWASYWNNNTFEKAVVVGANPPADPTTYSYTSGSYTFNNVRRIATRIQGEVDHAAAGDTVLIKNGVYEEAVAIDNKTVTLKGESLGAVVKAPVSVPVCTTTSYNWHPVICVKNNATATIDTLTVDGAGRGNSNNRFMGVAFRNAGGGVKNSVIDNIEETPFSGNQHGVGINLYNDDAASRTLEVWNNTISDFQKNGMAIITGGSSSLTVDIHGNNVQGKGATTVTAQNGIQVYQFGGSLTGEITDNIVDGIAYDNTTNPIKWVATSILNFYAPVDIIGNTVTNGHMGIYNIDASGNLTDNDLSIVKVGVYAFGIIATDPPEAVPAPYDGDIAPDKAAPEAVAATLTVNVSNNVVAFSGPDNTATYGIEADAGYGPDDIALTANGNTVTGFEVGIEIWQCETSCSTGVFTSVTANNNCLSVNTGYGMRSNAAYITSNGRNNYWGAASGPYHPTQNPGGAGDDVSDYIDFAPWLTTCGGSPTGNFHNITDNTYFATMQAAVNAASYGDVIVPIAAGPFGAEGSATVATDGVTIRLSGRTFGPGSPAFTITGDDVTILGPGVIDGGGSTSPGILVQAGAGNFTLSEAEVKGWADGIQVAGAVVSLKITSNWIHSNSDAGLQVDATPTGVITIKGNLFKNNGGPGVVYSGAGLLNATYNSWGDLAGPTGTNGDGAGAGVNFTPWTFSELYMDVNPPANALTRSVAETTSFDVALKADAAKLYGMAFQITYDPVALTLNSTTFSAPWAGACVNISVGLGDIRYRCNLTLPATEYDAVGGVIATFNFTANVMPPGDGPWPTYFDISHAPAGTSTGALGGVKVFVNNAGFNDPSTPARDITDTDDGEIIIVGLANFTGFVDLQGNDNDSGATLLVKNQQAKAGSIDLASGTSAPSGAYTTAHLPGKYLLVGSTYYLQFDAPLHLPTTTMLGSVTYTLVPLDWQNSALALTRPLTLLAFVTLLGGDATNNDVVDINDAACIGAFYLQPFTDCFGLPGSSPDVRVNGAVDIFDLVLMGSNYDLTYSPWTQP